MAIAKVRKVIDVEKGREVGVFGKQMTRRGALRLFGGIGAAAVAGGLLTTGASASSTGFYRTTTALNLRAKPRTDAKVLRVIPANAMVTDLGVTSNGYRKVVYLGTRGYAYLQYLTETNGGSTDTTFNDIGDAKTTSSVNLRADASTNAEVLSVIAKGKIVEISDRTKNGYRFVRVNGTLGWVYDDYLDPVDEGGPVSYKTTTSVNLRENPSLSGKVLKVVPAGKTVVDYDTVLSNGFRGVDYNGTVGWIHDDYLEKK